ncbi:hypothetical protein HG15A2_23110 [Adhaeretor mobilis]|uniref:Uncharacterized protein n=1 Tax=Adhaeretor mobilis TaxID=1930276 RepID=A0A517MVW3_9BACT|nr:hypothetical protein HG15A2_23110 [Adhaeretor mobilis]
MRQSVSRFQRRIPLLLIALLTAIFVMMPLAGLSVAQRVQFPSSVGTYNPPTPQPALQGFDPYNNSSLGPPPADVPYSYGNAAPYGQPSAPYGQPTPYGQPQATGSAFGNNPPVAWQSGSYEYQNSDGSVARLQRFLQQISFEHTWLVGEHAAQELEINRTELSATFGIPIFYNPDTPLLVTPGFAFNWLEGPVDANTPSADLPPRIYDAYLDTAWLPRLTDWLSLDLGFRTGVWTDFEEVNSESVRYLGRGLGVLSFSPQFELLAGVWYIDRNDIKLLPAGGVHWRPNSEWDAYLVFPNPKIRKRFVNVGSSQWWYYFAGQYGGGRWTIQRADGSPDDIDINDIRVIFGFEWETQTQARGHIEVGYVFDREILYAQTMAPARYGLDDTIMVRAGVDF